MKARITITYNIETDKTTILFDENFKAMHFVGKLDALQDGLGLLAQKYEKVHNPERKLYRKYKEFMHEEFNPENVVTLSDERIIIQE